MNLPQSMSKKQAGKHSVRIKKSHKRDKENSISNDHDKMMRNIILKQSSEIINWEKKSCM